jgi:hypothetical protein
MYTKQTNLKGEKDEIAVPIIISTRSSTQRENTSRLTNIQRGTRHMIEFTPPRKIPPPDQIFKDEPNRKPRRVNDPRHRDTVEDDWRVDVLDP